MEKENERKNKTFHASALEELCKVSDENTAKRVFGTQYNRMINELAYILKNEKKEMLEYAYRLNTAELINLKPITLYPRFDKSLGKIEYANFDIDFNNEASIKLGIYGYTIAHVYRMIKNEKERKY